MIKRIVIIWRVNWEEHTNAALRDAGHRSGAARRRVVSVLARKGCCLTAPEIADEVRAQVSGVGIASVYRVLDLLAETQLVQRVDLGDGRARFERAELADEHHHHLVCNECGRVEPFADENLEAALRRIER